MSYFNTSERRAVLFLLLFIISLQFAYFYLDFEKSNDSFTIDEKEIIAIQKEIDSLKLVEIESRSRLFWEYSPEYSR